MRRYWPLPRNTGNDRDIAPRTHSDLPKLRRKIMEQAGIVVVHKNKTLPSHLVNFLAQEGLKILADFDSLAELRANARASNPRVILLDVELLRDESEGYLEDLKRALLSSR